MLSSCIPVPKAAEREAEGVKEAEQAFERQQNTMRTELDQELRKIHDLYQERCRDYAQMVSDECEGEVSKAVSGEGHNDTMPSLIEQRICCHSNDNC